MRATIRTVTARVDLEMFSKFFVNEREQAMSDMNNGNNNLPTDKTSMNDTSESPAKFAAEKRNAAPHHNGAPPKKKPKNVRTKDLSAEVLNVRRRIQQCCKANDLATAMEAYDEAILSTVRIEAQTFYNLLNLCDGLRDRGIHIGTPKLVKVDEKSNDPVTVRTVDAQTRQQHAFRIKKHMDEMKLPLNETAYTALVRLLSKATKVDEAEQLLSEAEAVSQCKERLRLYSALLCAYCEMGRMEPALQLWTRLANKNLVLTEKEYAALIQCAIMTGDVRIMERVLSDLAEDVLVPSRDTARLISDWFALPHATIQDDSNTDISDKDSPSPCSVELPHSDAPSMGPVQCKIPGWIASTGCKVDTDSGILTTGCLKGESLHPVALSDKNWDEMKEMNETIVMKGMLDDDKSAFQGGGKGPKRHPSKQKGGVEKRMRSWKHFQSYLEKRKRFDVVIDGANVGYYKQNFSNAPKHVDYRQIDALLQHFAAQEKSVLLVMHERHFFPRLLPTWAVSIVESWNNVLYRTPSGMNDDWFWLHAALWNGRETLVVTNDEMRDHHFQMLAPRSFLRWKERHQIHFSFEWNNGQRTVELTFPETYSRRIQRVAHRGLVVPLPKRGDEHRYLDGTHTADDDYPEEETYLCIRPRK